MFVENLTDEQAKDISVKLLKHVLGEYGYAGYVFNQFYDNCKVRKELLANGTICVSSGASTVTCWLNDFNVIITFRVVRANELNAKKSATYHETQTLYKKLMYQIFGEEYLNEFKQKITNSYNNEICRISQEVANDIRKAGEEYSQDLKAAEDMTK